MAVILVVILAGVLFGALGGLSGTLLGGVAGWLLMRSLAQGRQIRELQRAVEALREARPAAPAAQEASVAPLARPVPEAPAPAPAIALASEPPAIPTPTPHPTPVPARARQPLAPAPALPEPLRRWLLEGNLIVKAGVAILFVGLAFLARYVGDQFTPPIEVRLAGIGAVALGLLGLGWRLRGRRAGYAQALQGGGVALLYLTLFAAFRFYGVVAAGPAFALMVGVAGLSALLAVRQQARALAVLGALGGFATPLLLSTGGGNPMVLFGYYLVLDLGIAAVAWHTTWRSLNLIGFFGTFLVATAWGVLDHRPEHRVGSQAFLIAYFLVFNAILLMPLRRLDRTPETIAGRETARWVNGSLLFGLPTVTLALQVGLVHDIAHGPALSALAMAAFYVAMAWRLRGRPGAATLFEGALAVGTVCLTLVIPLALDPDSTGGAWALEAAGLVWIGWRQGRRLARAFGYLLLGLAGGGVALEGLLGPVPAAALNGFLMNALLVAAGAVLAARAVAQAAPAGRERLAEGLLLGWAGLWLLLAAGREIDLFVPQRLAPAAWLVALSALAALATALAWRLDWPAPVRPAVLHAPVMGAAVLHLALQGANPLHDGGAWAWPVALATHALVLRHGLARVDGAAARAVHALGALVVAGLGALLGRALTATWGDAGSAWPWLGWLAVPAAMLLALPRPATARLWPVRLQPEAYQGLAGAGLAAGLLLWTLLANARSDGSARPLPAVPLLNPLDLGVALALVAAWRGLRAAPAGPLRPDDRTTAMVLAGAGFVWLNAMLIRAFHHHGGVPFRLEAWTASLAVQTGLTLLWSVTALGLMWQASRRGLRLPWLAGAGLLGLVTLKLLLIDLSGSGTVARIVSFIGVGVLMLVIGYVAPLPGAARPGPDHDTPPAPDPAP